jgi:hypothetical protein
MTIELSRVRQLWQLLEPVHATLYYAEQAYAEASRLGYDVRTRWPSYFAWRAAPLGAVDATQVASAFYSFSPAMVAAHVPAAWRVAAPPAVLAARLVAVDRSLTAILGDQVNGPDLTEAAKLARATAEAAQVAGRPLTAANAALEWADEPHLQLWQAATLLREHRGDGHVAALLAAGLDPCEALVSFAALGTVPTEVFASRGWTDDQWATAGHRLRQRGWLDERGQATDHGRQGRRQLERRTDELAVQPWQSIGDDAMERLVGLLEPLFVAVLSADILPMQTTLGLGAPPA